MNRSHDALGIQADTIIGPGVKVKGDLVSESDVVVDGTLEGDIKTTGDVTIGYNAKVKANVQARNITVGGHLVGDINAKEQTSILETGRVQGNIVTSSLAISAGAIFSGQTKMTAAETAITDNKTD